MGVRYIRSRNLLIAVLCLLTAFSGCFGTLTWAEGSFENVADGGAQTSEVQFEEFAEDVMALTDKYEPDETVADEFQTMRLIVEASYPVQDERAVEIAGGYEGLYILQYETAEAAREAYETFQGKDGISAVQPDRILDVNDTTEQIEQKSYLAWGAGSTGLDSFMTFLMTEYESLPEITVAVLDTGIDSSVSMFSGRICADGRNYVSSRKRFNTSDDNGHGTMVSSVIVDNTTDNVKLLPIKVMNKNGEGYDSQILLGMAYALDYGADIINMSIGGDGEISIYESIMKRAVQQSVPVIVAAGNESADVMTSTPANIESAITVSSVDSEGNLSSFSNYGATVDFAAPGQDIIVIGMGGRRYNVSGTSFATPYVSASYALIMSADSELSATDIYELLTASAKDLGTPGWDGEYGYGVLNLQGMEARFKGGQDDPVDVTAGDVDGDNCVTSVDAYYILCFLTGRREPDDKQWMSSDVDGDGEVTVLDVWYILKQETTAYYS